MNNVTEIYKGKQPRRPHFVQDWAELRGYKKAVDLAKALDIARIKMMLEAAFPLKTGTGG